MYVHTISIVTDQWLGHKSCGFAIAMCDVVYAVLEYLHLVGFPHQGIEENPDFTLPGGRDLVVVDLDFKPHLFHCQAHGRANVMQ